MSSVFEENRLIDLLRIFDAEFMLSYLERLRKFRKEAEDKGLLRSLISIRDLTSPEPIAFRAKFSEPILVMLSHPLCRMCAKIHYPIEFEWERFYVTQLGMLPTYFVDLNLITLIKFWGEAAEQAHPQALKQFLTGEAIGMKLSPATTKGIHYSTMNFIIPFGADLRKTPRAIDEIMRHYLAYSLWLSPKPGFSLSTHLLHSKASIGCVLKVAKTLCSIGKVNGQTSIQVLNRSIKAHKVDIQMLVEKDCSPTFMKRDVYVPDDIMNELQSAQQGQISLKESFLNAIILEAREGARSLELLSVISDIGASYFELARTLIAYILAKIYNYHDRIAYICSVDELRIAFNKMLEKVGRHIKLPHTASDEVLNVFDLALESLYPIFTTKEGKGNRESAVYYLHPLVFSFLYSRGYLDLLQKESDENINEFLTFLEKISHRAPYIPYMELYLDKTLDMFRGESRRELLSKLSELIRKIELSKLLQRSF
jgi:hypothetical protein